MLPINLVSALIVKPLISADVDALAPPMAVLIIVPPLIVELPTTLRSPLNVAVEPASTDRLPKISVCDSKSIPVDPDRVLILPEKPPEADTVVKAPDEGVVEPIVVPSIAPASMLTVPVAPVLYEPVIVVPLIVVAFTVVASTSTLLPVVPNVVPVINPPVIIAEFPKLAVPDTHKFSLILAPPVTCNAPVPAVGAKVLLLIETSPATITSCKLLSRSTVNSPAV